MKLVSEKFALRNWQAGDAESLVKYANNINIWLNVRDAFPHPYTLEDAKSWIEISSNNSQNVNLAIEVNGEAAGSIGFIRQRDVYYRSGELGYWLGEPFWNRGIITEAVKLFTQYLFQQFDICRIYAGVFAYNTGSMRVLEKAGFLQEGILRKAVTKNGQTVDEYVFGLVR